VAVVDDVGDVAIVIDNVVVVVAIIIMVVDPSSSSPLWHDVADIIVIDVV